MYFGNSKIHRNQRFDSLGIKKGSKIFLEVDIDGGAGKRPRFNIQEMAVREDDPALVATILSMKSFDGETWFQNLPKETKNEHLIN